MGTSPKPELSREPIGIERIFHLETRKWCQGGNIRTKSIRPRKKMGRLRFALFSWKMIRLRLQFPMLSIFVRMTISEDSSPRIFYVTAHMGWDSDNFDRRLIPNGWMEQLTVFSDYYRVYSTAHRSQDGTRSWVWRTSSFRMSFQLRSLGNRCIGLRWICCAAYKLNLKRMLRPVLKATMLLEAK